MKVCESIKISQLTGQMEFHQIIPSCPGELANERPDWKYLPPFVLLFGQRFAARIGLHFIIIIC